MVWASAGLPTTRLGSRLGRRKKKERKSSNKVQGGGKARQKPWVLPSCRSSTPPNGNYAGALAGALTRANQHMGKLRKRPFPDGCQYKSNPAPVPSMVGRSHGMGGVSCRMRVRVRRRRTIGRPVSRPRRTFRALTPKFPLMEKELPARDSDAD